MGQEKNCDMPDTPAYELITTPGALAAFADRVQRCAMVAVDLEADSMFHYREKVCLLQMAADGHTAVIDPLQVGGLEALRGLFADPALCKVLHGADYDVRSLFRDFGIVIHNLFDTQLAAMFLGEKETSLEALVQRRFGVELNKKYQKKNWSQRPLPAEMIAYAAWDVVFLIPLARMLMRELGQKGRLAWVEEECALLSRVRPAENGGRPLFMRIKGAGRLNGLQLTALEELLQLRNQLARQKDRPLFKVIGNAALLKIATALPRNLWELEQCQTLSRRQIEMYGAAILAALRVAQALPAEQLLSYPPRRSQRLSPRVPGRVKALRDWRDQVATEMDLDPALLFNKTLLRDIAVHKPQSLETLKAVPGINAWQVADFGAQVLDILKSVKG